MIVLSRSGRISKRTVSVLVLLLYEIKFHILYEIKLVLDSLVFSLDSLLKYRTWQSVD